MFNSLLYKYFLVGLMTVIIDYAILYFTFSILLVGEFISVTTAYLISGIFNFYFQKNFTFKSNGKYKSEILKFIAVAWLSYIFTILMIRLLTSYDINIYFAKLVTIFIVFMMVYIISNRLIYKQRDTNDS